MNNINTIFFLCVLIGLVSCFSKSSQSTFEIKKLGGLEEGADSVYLIRLSEGILIHWDIKAQHIVKDSLLSSVAMSFSDKQQTIINQILDTTETPVKICSTKRNLLVGDIAYLLIDEIKKIPDFQVFGMQWDSYGRDCYYPEGKFDYFNGYREDVKFKLERYLTSK